MSLCIHVTTADLLRRHPDLYDSVFANGAWQRGTAGEISGTSVPTTFSATDNDAAFKHWLGSTESPITNFTPDIVLNIPARGFFRVDSITNNQTATIGYLSQAHQYLANQRQGISPDNTDIAEGDELAWSLGGWEASIAEAWLALLSDLDQRGYSGSALGSTEAAFTECLKIKALELVFTSLAENDADMNAALADKYGAQYRNALNNARPINSAIRSAMSFERNG